MHFTSNRPGCLNIQGWQKLISKQILIWILYQLPVKYMQISQFIQPAAVWKNNSCPANWWLVSGRLWNSDNEVCMFFSVWWKVERSFERKPAVKKRKQNIFSVPSYRKKTIYVVSDLNLSPNTLAIIMKTPMKSIRLSWFAANFIAIAENSKQT